MPAQLPRRAEAKEYKLTVSMEASVAERFLAACEFRRLYDKNVLNSKAFFASVLVRQFVISKNKQFNAYFRRANLQKEFEDFLKNRIMEKKRGRKKDAFDL